MAEGRELVGPAPASPHNTGGRLGSEDFQVTAGEAVYRGQDLLAMSPEGRAREGIFLAFQYPVEIPGVATMQFLKVAMNEQRKRPHVVIAGAGFGEILQRFAPAHSRPAADDIDDAFQFAVMVRPGLGVGMNRYSSRPKLGSAGARMGNRRRPRHPRSLRGIGIELRAANDLHSVIAPILFGCRGHGFLLR